jgi:hypothetical protein
MNYVYVINKFLSLVMFAYLNKIFLLVDAYVYIQKNCF